MKLSEIKAELESLVDHGDPVVAKKSRHKLALHNWIEGLEVRINVLEGGAPKTPKLVAKSKAKKA